MLILLIIMFITIIILSVVCFGIDGLFVLLIILPLFILYIKTNNINKKEEKYDKNNLSERKEVEVVSSRDRKNAINDSKKKKITKEKNKNTNDKKQNVRKGKKTEKKKKSFFKKLLIFVLMFAIFCVFAVAAFMIYIVVSTGKFDPEALKNQDQTIIYDKDNNVIAKLGAQKRESVTYDDLPQVLVDAIVATEDSRYYQHNGVDTARFLKASILQVLGHNDAGGASTLTMQVVKNNLTDTNSSGINGIIRKFKDVYLSVFFMEKKYTKEEILEMYVNDSCLGGTVYGVEEASKKYFGKTVSQLSLPEASLLAGMYQAPNRYNPYKDPEAAAKRRATVLKLMVRHGYITQQEADMANAVDISSMLVGAIEESDYQGYIDTVIEEVQEKTGDDPMLVSMKIYTAMDKSIQDGINKVLSGESHSWENDTVQAGVAVTNVTDGTIVAIGAGRNRTAGDWNYATQAHRQPGSTAKPIFDYGPGFEYNDFSTYTLFNDEPWAYTNGPTVNNWDGSYEGLITLRRAISVSRNVPALKAFQQVDNKNIADFVNGLGLDIAYSTKSDNYKTYDNGATNLLNEAYAIGGMDYGVTPLDMAEAYACFANGGYHIETHAVTKIEYRSTGKVVDFTEEKKKVMSDSTAYLMNNVLKYAVDAAFNGGAKAGFAAKTGTSNLSSEITSKLGIPSSAVNDLWTVAYSPEYSVALWYGYEKVDSSHYLGGASTPKDNVMRSIMKYIPSPSKTWDAPSSVVQVTVEKDTWPAQLPSEYTPDDMKVTEYFKKGTQPTEVSQRYAKLPEVTNLKSSNAATGIKLTWNWKAPDVLDSSYLNKYFSNSVFGNGSANFLKSRLDYNESTLGGIGFGIYEKGSNGTLKLIKHVKDTEYTYYPTRVDNIEIVVKAEYGNFKSNASNGVSTTVNVSSDIISQLTQELDVSLNGDDNITLIQGSSYSDDGVTVKYNDEILSNNSVVITYSVDGKLCTSKRDLEKTISSLKSGESVTIKYNVSYLATHKGTATRNVTISQ